MAISFHGSPCNGHTLSNAMARVERIGKKPEHAFVDMGYRGHGYHDRVHVHVDKWQRDHKEKSHGAGWQS